MTGALVIIPTFNQATNVGPIIEAVLTALPAANVLIVDDASPDGTAQAAAAVGRNYEDGRVEVLRRPGKAGLGTAYVDGFEWGLERGHDVIIQMDADFQHDPGALPGLVAALDRGADVAVGSRYVSSGSVPAAWPRRRKALSQVANLYARTALRPPVHDVTAGFRAYRSEVLAGLDVASIGADGYGFQIGLTYLAVLNGAQIREVPIQFGERTRGTSKMSLRIMVEAFWLVARMAPIR